MKPTFAVCAALIVNASPALAQTKPHTDSTATVKKGGIHIQTAKPTTKVSIKGKTSEGPDGAFALEKVDGSADQLKLVFKARTGFTLNHAGTVSVSLAGTGSIDKTEPMMITSKTWPAENQPQSLVIHLKHATGPTATAAPGVSGTAGFSVCEMKKNRKVCSAQRYQTFNFP